MSQILQEKPPNHGYEVGHDFWPEHLLEDKSVGPSDLQVVIGQSLKVVFMQLGIIINHLGPNASGEVIRPKASVRNADDTCLLWTRVANIHSSCKRSLELHNPDSSAQYQANPSDSAHVWTLRILWSTACRQLTKGQAAFSNKHHVTSRCFLPFSTTSTFPGPDDMQ